MNITLAENEWVGRISVTHSGATGENSKLCPHSGATGESPNESAPMHPGDGCKRAPAGDGDLQTEMLRRCRDEYRKLHTELGAPMHPGGGCKMMPGDALLRYTNKRINELLVENRSLRDELAASHKIRDAAGPTIYDLREDASRWREKFEIASASLVESNARVEMWRISAGKDNRIKDFIDKNEKLRAELAASHKLRLAASVDVDVALQHARHERQLRLDTENRLMQANTRSLAAAAERDTIRQWRDKYEITYTSLQSALAQVAVLRGACAQALARVRNWCWPGLDTADGAAAILQKALDATRVDSKQYKVT